MNLSSQGVEIVGGEDTIDTKKTKKSIFTPDFVTAVGGGLSSLLNASQWGKPAAPTPGAGAMPAWLMPVMIGGVGLVALSIFATGRKKRR